MSQAPVLRAAELLNKYLICVPCRNFPPLMLTQYLYLFCSCYANVVLQCLAFTPPLTAYFLQGLHSKECMLRSLSLSHTFDLYHFGK